MQHGEGALVTIMPFTRNLYCARTAPFVANTTRTQSGPGNIWVTEKNINRLFVNPKVEKNT